MKKHKNKPKRQKQEEDDHLDWLLAIDLLKCEPH